MGVKVTLCDAVPTFGFVVGVVKANEPAGVEALPDADEDVRLTLASINAQLPNGHCATVNWPWTVAVTPPA